MDTVENTRAQNCTFNRTKGRKKEIPVSLHGGACRSRLSNIKIYFFKRQTSQVALYIDIQLEVFSPFKSAFCFYAASIKRYCYNRFRGLGRVKVCRNKDSHPENVGNF